MRLLQHVLILFFISTSGVVLPADKPADNGPLCKLQPMWREQRFPDVGFKDLDDETKVRNPCKLNQSWETFVHQGMKYFVSIKGPSGSGRYWNITLGLAQAHDIIPTRGICFTVSTVGWRTLQRFRALEWLINIDSGATPQLVLWNSFFLDDSAMPQRSGLSVWVYNIGVDGLQFDEAATRHRYLELKNAYLKPLARTNLRVYKSRHQIARVLDIIATNRCRFKKPDDPTPIANEVSNSNTNATTPSDATPLPNKSK